MNVITLTLSPAVDVICRTDTFKPFRENLAVPVSRNAGGKGINVTRALLSGNVSALPVLITGAESEERFLADLKDEIPVPRVLTVDGRIRENLTVRSAEGETRISFPGFTVPADTLSRVRALISDQDLSDCIVTFTGSLPNGITEQEAVRFLSSLQAEGAKLVIDSKSISLKSLLFLKPWLIKPNEEEVEAYFPKKPALAGHYFLNAGIENVLLSRGKNGARLCRKEACYTAKVPEITPVSTIGAGDSTVAGFITAFLRGEGPASCLKTAVAFGTAACLTEGSLPPKKADVSRILDEITVTEERSIS